MTKDDIQSVNFREICMGNIAPKTLYRSSHPIKENKQEKIISLLAAEARIAAVINLSDTDSELSLKVFLAPWYNKLYKNDRVIALAMDYNTAEKYFTAKIKNALQFIINTRGPWLIHCNAGVDRTGFVSMILEAFMGAGIDDISADYLASFNSIFDSAVYNDINKKDSSIVMRLLSVMDYSAAISDQNLQPLAEKYLENTVELSARELVLLKKKLSGQ